MRVIHRIIHARRNRVRAATARQRAVPADRRVVQVGHVPSQALITGRMPAIVQPAARNRVPAVQVRRIRRSQTAVRPVRTVGRLLRRGHMQAIRCVINARRNRARAAIVRQRAVTADRRDVRVGHVRSQAHITGRMPAIVQPAARNRVPAVQVRRIRRSQTAVRQVRTVGRRLRRGHMQAIRCVINARRNHVRAVTARQRAAIAVRRDVRVGHVRSQAHITGRMPAIARHAAQKRAPV
jgi:hypothetical protein